MSGCRIITIVLIASVLVHCMWAQEEEIDDLVDREERRGARRRQQNTDSREPEEDIPMEEDFSYVSPVEDITCKQRNKCSRREGAELGFYDQNCFCDNMCRMYGDCCKDYDGTLPDHIPAGFRLAKKTLSCHRVIPIDATSEIYRVEKCPSGYEDAFVREKCEHEGSSVFLEIPVSGRQTGVLYKNYYCAVCAGDLNVTFWNVEWQCEKGPSLQNLTNTEQLLDDVWVMGEGNCIYEFTHPTMTYRRCKSHLSRCPKHWSGDPSVARKCKENTAYVYLDSLRDFSVFRNEYCAQCYDINSTYLTCRDPRGIGIRDHIGSSSASNTRGFSIVLDIPTATGRIKTRDGEVEPRVITFRQCEEFHVYDPFNKICVRIGCPEDKFFIQGQCLSEDDPRPRYTSSLPITSTTLLTTRRTRKPITRRTTIGIIPHTPGPNFFPTQRNYAKDTSNHNQEHSQDIDTDNTLECPTTMFNLSDYTIMKNNSVFIHPIQQRFDIGGYFKDGSTIHVCSSSIVSNDSVSWLQSTKILMFQFDRIQKLVSFIGILISLISLLICFVAHMILPPIRTVAGKCIVGLSVSLFLGQGLYLAGALGITHDLACMIIGIVMHFAFIASFCWTNCLAVEICQAFASGRGSHTEDTTNRYVSHSLYSWLFPAVIVGGSVALELVDFTPLGVEQEIDMFRPYYGDGVCWITRRNGLIFLFAAPVGIMVLVNFFTYIATMKYICSVPVVGKAATRRSKDKNRFLLYIKLTFIMAIAWTFAFLASMTEFHFMWYIFIAFFSLQGAFICFAFVCTRKVFRLLKTIGRVHKSSANSQRPYHRAYSNATTANNPWAYSRGSNFMYEGMDSKVIAQETSI